MSPSRPSSDRRPPFRFIRARTRFVSTSRTNTQHQQRHSSSRDYIRVAFPSPDSIPTIERRGRAEALYISRHSRSRGTTSDTTAFPIHAPLIEHRKRAHAVFSLRLYRRRVVVNDCTDSRFVYRTPKTCRSTLDFAPFLLSINYTRLQ